MNSFKNMLGHGETLIKNETVLDYGYIPKLIPYREAQMRAMVNAIKPLFQKRRGRNLFVHGPPGVGKTVAMKHIIQELEEETDEIMAFYINCWKKNTTYKILLEMCDVIGYKLVQNKRTEELLSILRTFINTSKSAVFIFDEVDKIEEMDIIYFILEDIFRKSVILITNYSEYVTELDERIKSRLTPEVLEFKAYNAEESRGILKERKEQAFFPGSWNEDAFELSVQTASKVEDLRTGLYIMRESALNAEDRSSKKITIEDVHSALKKFKDFSIKKKNELDEESQEILETIKENTGKKIGDLYRTHQARTGKKMVYKTFQRKIAKLAEDQFITTEKIEGGKEGKTTIISYGKAKKLTEF